MLLQLQQPHLSQFFYEQYLLDVIIQNTTKVVVTCKEKKEKGYDDNFMVITLEYNMKRKARGNKIHVWYWKHRNRREIKIAIKSIWN